MPERSVDREMDAAEAVQIEVGGPQHLAEVLALSQAAADAPHWPPDAWRNFVEASECAGDRRNVLLLARAREGEVIGWLAASGIYETAELEFVLVHPRRRGQGVGRQLLQHWMQWARDRGALEALLEVRPSSEAALRMYRQVGFVERGRRTGYYHAPSEDAVLMWRALDQTGADASSWRPRVDAGPQV